MTLHELQQSQIHRVLLRSGYSYPKLINHIELYFYYNSLIVRGENIAEAATWTADKFNYHEATVRKIVKKIKSLNEICQKLK